MAVAAERPTLESLDTNKDGEISLNEASANDALFVAFKQLDTNRDGLLSKTEFAAWKG
jgi:Ca2+-binding EF-hand superfamily protein